MTRFVVLLIALLLASQSWAITFDTASSGEGTTSTSHNHTFASSTTGFAGICISQRESTSGVQPITAVTVGGNAATFLDAQNQASNVMRAEFWYYLNPPAGSTAIAVTADASTDRMLTAVVSYTGVAQTSTFNTVAKAEGSSTNADVDGIPSALNELALSCIASRRGTVIGDTTATPDGTVPTSTERRDTAHTVATSNSVHVYEEAGAATSTDIRVDLSETVQWAAVGVSIRPDVPAEAFGPLRRRQ